MIQHERFFNRFYAILTILSYYKIMFRERETLISSEYVVLLSNLYDLISYVISFV